MRVEPIISRSTQVISPNQNFRAATSPPGTDLATTDTPAATQIVLIEKRPFMRDCLSHCLQPMAKGKINSFSTIEAWLAVDAKSMDLIVLCTSGGQRSDELLQVERIAALAANTAPIVVMSDFSDPDHIIAVLAKGARGFLTTDIALEIAIEAMRFVCAGGIFIPANSLLAARSPTTANAPRPMDDGGFTMRQIAVIKALRQGKANKIIAYELSMCESTVKVHVRNIMKKLKAKNRTHAAFIANDLLLNLDRA